MASSVLCSAGLGNSWSRLSDAEKQKANSEELAFCLFLLVGAAGFELATPLHPMQVRYQAALRPDKLRIIDTYLAFAKPYFNFML